MTDVRNGFILKEIMDYINAQGQIRTNNWARSLHGYTRYWDGYVLYLKNPPLPKPELKLDVAESLKIELYPEGWSSWSWIQDPERGRVLKIDYDFSYPGYVKITIDVPPGVKSSEYHWFFISLKEGTFRRPEIIINFPLRGWFGSLISRPFARFPGPGLEWTDYEIPLPPSEHEIEKVVIYFDRYAFGIDPGTLYIDTNRMGFVK